MNHKYRSMFMCGYVHLTEKGVDAKALETKMEPHEHMDDFKKKWGRSVVNEITWGCGETNMETSAHKTSLCQASIMSRDNLQQNVIFRSNKAASFGNFIMFLFGYAMDKQ